MSKKDVYRYWAVLHYAPEGVSVRFPDLPGCFTSGDTAEQAHVEAKEALGGFLCIMENEGDDIPDPSSLDTIMRQLEEDEAVCEVRVYMPTVREAMESRAVKKTLTVPKWLNDEAERNGLNFSAILQDGIKRSLGITADK
ncbi:type II toxin-antitoxin system HicB family antitoxin [Cohnella silvisoli]|uniref:Type II toxin-antitoxin system HicB family antitoxin n=1 Tax=Cohnella silvisoli TaxID=2873699 RepID=A0ABV1L4P1_9BACL|nr:type II toxin-antitoxin system HicB family antitoxin [Cohnella silvisoli]MCD9026065.1 type II toxin-antitoxin system HicB family antitoxin [Cohnella silvisoli]